MALQNLRVLNMGQQLQHLSIFSDAGNWLDGEAHKVEHGISTEYTKVSAELSSELQKFKSNASSAENSWLAAAHTAALRVGPDFKIAGADMLWAAGEVW